ncbi:hypothetical protein [Escherichia phage CLB_P2]|nr:hypothetical protein [Escherichia phage CLB_P2]
MLSPLLLFIGLLLFSFGALLLLVWLEKREVRKIVDKAINRGIK